MLSMNLELLESGVARGTGKRRRAKIISADIWGSSGFYPTNVLERDAARVIVPGVKMFENHQTATEDAERPERDISKLVGKVTSVGVFEADNPNGPGIYADVEFYDSYINRINEIAGDVGLSITGIAEAVEGEAQNRRGSIVTELVAINSVDVVVAPGAGGKLVSILESQRPIAGKPITEIKENDMPLTLEEFNAGIERIIEAVVATVQNTPQPGSVGPEAGDIMESAEEPATEEVAESAEETVVEEAAEETPVAESAPAEPVEVAEAVAVDYPALLTAFNEANLPNAVLSSVVTAVQEGASVEDAIATQVKLGEAFTAKHGETHVTITEAAAEQVPFNKQILNAINPGK